MPNDSINSRLELAKSAAVAAGKITLQYFQSGVAVERKADQSPVTIADRESEQLLRKQISEHFPDDGIIGEEFGEQAGSSSIRWILDPIDGTKSFISGVPLYGTLVGLMDGDECVAGVIYIPGLDEMVYAAVGQGAWYVKDSAEPVRAQVSEKTDLSDSLFVTSEVKTFRERNAIEVYERLEQAAYITRSWGDCYGYLLVATGRAEVMVDPEMNIWDAAAVKPVIDEAGGSFTDWQGQPTVATGDGVATNGRVSDAVLEVTRAFAN
jgi:histidinol phosphatase-like enzyme (inositol monophosphatase family)